MADPICRWRNPYVNTIIKLVKALPHQEMSSDDFRTIIEERWPGFLHTPYQLACQMGLYYESEDGMYYPRFNHDIDENEARSYMERWIERYYVPNPYTKSMKTLQQPQPFLASIIRYVCEHPNETELHSILEAVFQEKIGNIDIISNILNTYTDLIKVDAIGNVELTDKAIDFMKQYIDRNDKKAFFENFSESNNTAKNLIFGAPGTAKFLPYLTALRTKPFILLAGISGTGKSRIVRELSKACWQEGDEEFGKNHPKNFCMVQVKPNWHDSSELIGYVSRINGEKFVVGPFLRFLAKASKDPNTPYFLCLDEMNLAPVEQYFAEYLSVIESRKLNKDGSITTDPIIPFENTEAYGSLIDQLFDDEEERKAYKTENNGKRLTIPQNLFVVGTVNMDETTFSFSRKVLDRAMTIEMNEVDLHGGLTDEETEIGYIGNSIIGTAAEGKDVYSSDKELCDNVLSYLEKVNHILEGTPFKIAYRTRNEFLLYAVNREFLDKDSQLWQTLDEMTSMKILSRIEGDSERTQNVLNKLKELVDDEIVAQIPTPEEGKEKLKSVSASKIEEMLGKLKVSGYTSYWT